MENVRQMSDLVSHSQMCWQFWLLGVILFQCQKKDVVLKTMVETVADWIFAGLPLRSLKIVIYEGINKEFSQVFVSIKKKLLKKNKVLKVGSIWCCKRRTRERIHN